MRLPRRILGTAVSTKSAGSSGLVRVSIRPVNGQTNPTIGGNLTVTGTTTSGAINGQTISSSANFTGSLAVATTGSFGTSLTVGTPGTNVGSINLSTSASNSRQVILQGLNPTGTGNATIQIPTIAGGATDTVCLVTLGNCAGSGGGVTGSGTLNTIALFTGSGTIGNSVLTQSGTTISVGGALTATGALQGSTINGASVTSTTFNTATISGGSLSSTAVNGLLVSGTAITGTGALAVTSGGTNQNLVLNASGTGQVQIGGTSTGDILLGGGVGSTGCTVTNSSGNLACSGTLTSGSSGASGLLSLDRGDGTKSFKISNLNDEIQSYASGGNSFYTWYTNLASTNTLVMTLSNAGQLQLPQTGSAAGLLLGGDATLYRSALNTLKTDNNFVVAGALTSGLINGQTISSSANLTGTLTVQGASVTIGTPGTTAGSLNLANATSSRQVILQGLNPTGTGNATIQIPTIAGGATDTVCLLTLANCAAAGGVTGSGTSGNIAKFNGTNSITNSGLSESGTTLTYAGNAIINAGSGFTGNLLNLQVNASSKYSVNELGNSTQSGTLTVNGTGSSSIAGTLTVATGLTVTSGGFTVSAGGESITGGSTIAGGTIQLNNNSNNNTNINTGTSTGSVTIGNSAAGAVGVVSGAAVNITGGAASTISTTAGNLTLQGGSGTVSLGTSTSLTAAGALAVTAGGTNQNLTVNASGTGQVQIGGTSTGDILIGGGVGSTGCTITNSNGNLACSGSISSTATSGTQGWFSRSGTTLQPTNSGDVIQTAGSGGDTIALFTTASGAYISNVSTATGHWALATQVSGDSQRRFVIEADGSMYWGSGAATQDTDLYRSAAGTPVTDTNFVTGGDIQINGGDLTTNQTTFNLLNTTATTLNVGGAASTLNIGPGGSTAASINLAGGSGATGCTVDGATGNLTCTGAISGSNISGTGSIFNQTSLQAANFHVQSAAVGSVTGQLQALTSQTADLLDFENASGAVVSGFTVAGALQGANASGTNAAGTNLVINGGQGTGTGVGGNINFQVAKAGTTGSTLNNLATVVSLSGTNGAALFQNSANSSTAFQIQNASGQSVSSVILLLNK